MRYKSTYGPSQILDAHSNTWTPLTTALEENLKSHHYYSPSAAATGVVFPTTRPGATDGDEDSDSDGEQIHPPGFLKESDMPGLATDKEMEEKEFEVGNMLLMVSKGKGGIVPAFMLEKWKDEEWVVRKLVEEIVKAVGLEVAGRIVISFA